MSEEDLTNYKTYISDLDITKYVVLDNESNYWYSAEYVDKMLKKQDKEIERLNSIIKEVREYIENGNYRFREGTDICLYQEGNEVFYMENDELMARKILSILEKENKDGER